MNDRDALRQNSRLRLASSLERFDDVVAELIAVHGLSETEIVGRVARIAEDERDVVEELEGRG